MMSEEGMVHWMTMQKPRPHVDHLGAATCQNLLLHSCLEPNEDVVCFLASKI